MKNDEIQNNDKINEINEPTPIKNDVGDSNNLQPVKNNNWIISVLLIIIILLAAGLVYVLFFTKPNDEVKDNNTQETEKEKEAEPQEKEEEPKETETNKETDKKYTLNVYKEIDGNYLTNDSEPNSNIKVAFTIKVSTEDAKVIAVDYFSNDLVLYNDNGLYIYNNKDHSSKKLNLENTNKEYRIFLNEAHNKIIGIGYPDKNGKYGYYNVEKGIKLYTGKYNYEDVILVNQINDHYMALQVNKTSYILSTDSESAPKLSYTDKEYGEYMTYSSFGTNGNYIYALTTAVEVIDYNIFYDKNFKQFYEVPSGEAINDTLACFDNGYLYFYNNNKLFKYNTSGKLISSSTDYKDVKLISKGYVVYVKNDNLVLEKIDNSNESKVLTKWNKGEFVDADLSGYYTKESLERNGESNKEEGLYVIYYYGDDGEKAIRDGRGNYGIEFCYTNDKQVIEYQIKHEMGGRAKPVLYLYPTKETNVTVKFEKPELLTTTYPKYINSWNVKVSPNGDMYDKDGKYYYALYWDEKRYNEVDFKEGFYVEGKDAIKFLEEKLTIIGLNDKERNEFIMYWLPIMEANKKNLVYFELTEERELGNKLIITPKPDSLLRVSIHIKKVNEKVNIKEQKLESFKRVGFTAVEWGGMTY